MFNLPFIFIVKDCCSCSMISKWAEKQSRIYIKSFFFCIYLTLLFSDFPLCGRAFCVLIKHRAWMYEQCWPIYIVENKTIFHSICTMFDMSYRYRTCHPQLPCVSYIDSHCCIINKLSKFTSHANLPVKISQSIWWNQS